MGYEALKSELIEWLEKLEDEETISYLKLVKDANVSNEDWSHELTKAQRSDIKRGLKDVEEGRITPHEIVKQKYGL